jgi:LmbE family N-acetylglucosaminyl deacetylase
MTTALLMPMSNQAHAGGPPEQPNSGQIALALRKLGVVGSVLYVAAHPDDENTNLLAYLSNERLVRTAYLSLTRGDGGQNLIGSEQGVDLGVIRTQELLAARRIDGAEQLFTRARDFGYSKTPEETLRIWGKDAVLADVVYAIRRFRPDVIITRFSPLPSDTHGHHTASAQLTLEAFRAAADPAFHPEQLSRDVRPWQARRIYWNRSSWSIKPGEDLSGFMKLDVNGYNPLLGLSYGEMAADSRSMHKSQGFGVARTRGPIVEYFKLLASDKDDPQATHGILDGLDLTWTRFKKAAEVRRLIKRAQAEFKPEVPHTIIPTLLHIDQALAALDDAAWQEKKTTEVRNLLVACAGLYAEATAADARVVPGTAVDVTFSAINRSPAAVRLREIHLLGARADEASVVPVGQELASVELKRRLQIAADLPLSTPHWLALAPEPGMFHIADANDVNAPVTDLPIHVEFIFDFDGHAVSVRRPLTYKWTDPVDGERNRPVEIAPLVSVEPQTQVLVIPNGEQRSLAVRVAAAAPVSGNVLVEAPAGWNITPAAQSLSLAGRGAEVVLRFQVKPPSASASTTLRVVANVDGKRFTATIAHIEHRHIPIQAVVRSTDVRAVAFPLERKITTVGYIPGPGDEVAASLRQAGYDVRMLSEDGLTETALEGLPAVVIGVRAFNAKEKLRAAQPILTAYVNGGGTLVVQYNTNNRLAPLSTPIGPFPFDIGSERVTDETATVTFTSPAHRLLTTPNTISAQDFAGWVQERGLYFAKNWDSRYETLLRMGDPGEKPLDGSVLYARHGKGAFVYTGLAFFRQLPAGVPGAFRLFANLLAAGQAQPSP